MRQSSADYLSKLHLLLNDHFNLAEIRTLCLNLNIDYESVAGEEKPSRIRELLLGLARRERLPELLEIVAEQRPRTEWPTLPDNFQLPESLMVGGMAVPANQYHIYGTVVGSAIGEGASVRAEIIAGGDVIVGLTPEQVTAMMIDLSHEGQPVVWNGRIPYLGLNAYQEKDAQFFFGRESLVEELLNRVQAANFITIAGPSGSGKSSVARAGLFYALRRGFKIENSDRWLLATMQPKGDPFTQLTKAMEKATKSTAVGDALKPTDKEYPAAETLLRHIAMYLEDENGRCVLLVDQFEELFTQTKDPQQRQAFIDLLTQAVQDTESRFTVIISLRSDFVSHCASHEKLRKLISQQFQLVGAMEPRDLAKAITLPALEVGAEIDPALVSRIITDMKGSPDALPLMSFALRDLFEVEKTEKGKPMDLTLGEYIERGGLEKALEEHANKVFNNFTNEQKEIAKNIFSKLIEVGQGRVDTRRTATFAELVPADSNAEAVETVLRQLETVRLVTTGGLSDEDGQLITTDEPDSTVTIAHEKMIDAWPWLRTLVDENRDLIALQNQINNDAQAWASEKDEGFLYRGGRLLQVEEKLKTIKPYLDKLSLEFIQASLEQREREHEEAEANRQREEDLKSQRRISLILRWATGIVVILLIVAVISAFQAISGQAAADTARATSDANAQLAAQNAMTATRALATSVAAEATSDVNASLANAREAEVRELKDIIQANQLAGFALSEVENAPEKALLVAVAGFRLSQQSNTYISLVTSLQTPYRISFLGHGDSVSSATFSSNGEQILTASDDGTARLWDLEGNELAVLRGHESGVYSAMFNSDGERIVTASDDGTARLWDLEGNELAVLSGHESSVYSAKFSPSGKQIVTVSWDDTARLWDLAGNELAVLSGHESSVNSATFSPNGEQIVTANLDGTARIWDLAGNELAVLSGHEASITSVTFSPDGKQIITDSLDGTARLWEWQLGRNETAELIGYYGWVNSATFSPDGEKILTALADGTARLWDLAGNELVVLNGDEAWIWSATFSPNGEQVMAVSADGAVRVWDLAGNELAMLVGVSATFSQDGKHIVTVNNSGIVQSWLWSNFTTEYVLEESYQLIERGFFSDECEQYFKGDPQACPRSKRALFEPLVEYLTPEQQADWQSLEE